MPNPPSDAPKRPRARTRAREYLESEASAANRRIHRALHIAPRGRSASPITAEEEATLEETREVVRELRAELADERESILEPLLRRMSDLAERFGRDEKLPVALLRDGLELWQAYVVRLHDVHVGQFAAARSSVPHSEACSLQLIQLSEDPGRAEMRIGEIRQVLVGFEARAGPSAALLAAVVKGNVRSELAWENFEEDTARSCLPDHLTASALRQWRTSLVETRSAIDEIRTKVRGFLERTQSYALDRPAITSRVRSSPSST